MPMGSGPPLDPARSESCSRDTAVTILYIYQGEWPRGATRVAKQVRSLARAGHAVHLVARNYDGAPRLETWEQVTVHRLPWVRVRWLTRVLNFPVFLNPMWTWAMWRLVRSTGADRSEEHTSELQSRLHLVCRLLLEKKK